MPADPERVKTGSKDASEQARTRFARGEVVTAASALFAEQGFAATTVAELSERAQIPAATVYRLFGSKLGILKAWLDVAIGGDDAPVPVADRPSVAELLTGTDPRDLIAGFVHVTSAINGRSNTVYRVLVGAAETDPAATTLLREIARQRAAGQRQLTRALAGLGALRSELTERRAADIVYAMMSPETYRLLVVDRGWTTRRYQQWLAPALCHELLG